MIELVIRYVKFDTFTPAAERGLPVTRVISRMLLQEILAGAVGDDVIINGSNVVDFQDLGNKVIMWHGNLILLLLSVNYYNLVLTFVEYVELELGFLLSFVSFFVCSYLGPSRFDSSFNCLVLIWHLVSVYFLG